MRVFGGHYSADHSGETGPEAEAVGMDGDQGCVRVMKERAEIWGPERPGQNHYKIREQDPLFRSIQNFKKATAEH